MRRTGVRTAAMIAAALLIAAGLVSGCSQRERAPMAGATPTNLTAEPEAVVQTGARTQIDADDPHRSDCRPAGSLGPANPTEPGPFVATFTAAPDEPLGVCGASEWDIEIHSRNPETWYSLESMTAQHGADCAGPPATHETHGSHNAAVFLCRDHLMTALKADSYGVIYFSPNQLVDLSQGPVSIRFDLSTERMSTRDWVDMWLMPWDNNMALPLEESDPDLQGPPRNSIQVLVKSGENSPVLLVTRDGVQREFHKGYEVAPLEEGVAPGTNQAATRQPFQLTVGGGRAKFERLESPTARPLVFWDEAVEFPFDAAVLQFGHHSYTPTKDGAGEPGTWHWDNIGISRAIPFTLIRAVERYADSQNPTVTFESPAGPNASLRFSAIGTPELSFDGGKSWSAAVRQDGLGQRNPDDHHPEHFSSFWTPIPAGTMSVRVRFKDDDWYSGPYFAQDFAIWSR